MAERGFGGNLGVDVHIIDTDQLGSPRVITDANNTEVWRWDSDPFGTTPVNEDPDGEGNRFTYNLRFPGQYYDEETGHHYNVFRDYNPGSGRYIESDPIGLDGGLNTYAYVYGNPVHYYDPLGLCIEDLCIGEAAAAITWCMTNPVCATGVAGIIAWGMNNSSSSNDGGSYSFPPGSQSTPAPVPPPDDEEPEQCSGNLSSTRYFNRGQNQFTLEQGTARSGWKHIYDRHVDTTRFLDKSKFPTSATEQDIVNALDRTLTHGSYSTYEGLDVYTFRTNYGGWGYRTYRATVNLDGTVRTFHPMN